MKKLSLAAEYAAVSQTPKSTVDRRVNRPSPGDLHYKELERMLNERMLKGLIAQVAISNYAYEVTVHIRPDYDVYYQMPMWKRNALDSIYETWYLRANIRGWISGEAYTVRSINNIERQLNRARKEMMRQFRISRELETVDNKSLKGKPRRVVKSGNFEEYFNKQRDHIGTTGTVIDLLPTVPNLDSARTWGIEIEVAGSRGIGVPSGWDAVEDGSLRSPYSTWEGDCDCDCEACSEWEDHDCGGNDCAIGVGSDSREFVSPILRGMYAPGITSICDGARFEPQNTTAGIHVHVGADGLTPKQIGGLVYAYGLLEDMLEQSYKREEREYCEGLDWEAVQSVLSKARTAVRQDSMAVLDRYTTVNVQALSKHGTIEFRALGPVYEGEYVHKWALFCREMVNVAANNVPLKVWGKVRTFEDVMDVFRQYGSELNAIEAIQKSDATKNANSVIAELVSA